MEGFLVLFAWLGVLGVGGWIAEVIVRRRSQPSNLIYFTQWRERKQDYWQAGRRW